MENAHTPADLRGYRGGTQQAFIGAELEDMRGFGPQSRVRQNHPERQTEP